MSDLSPYYRGSSKSPQCPGHRTTSGTGGYHRAEKPNMFPVNSAIAESPFGHRSLAYTIPKRRSGKGSGFRSAWSGYALYLHTLLSRQCRGTGLGCIPCEALAKFFAEDFPLPRLRAISTEPVRRSQTLRTRYPPRLTGVHQDYRLPPPSPPVSTLRSGATTRSLPAFAASHNSKMTCLQLCDFKTITQTPGIPTKSQQPQFFMLALSYLTPQDTHNVFGGDVRDSLWNSMERTPPEWRLNRLTFLVTRNVIIVR